MQDQGVRLIDAAKEGNINEIIAALDAGANINAREDNSNDSALFKASYYGHFSIVKLLLNKGADIELKGYQQMTPLHAAAQNNHVAIGRLLIEYGANIEAVTNVNAVETPLHYAGFYGNELFIKFLVDEGANTKALNKGGKTPAERALENGQQTASNLIQTYSANKLKLKRFERMLVDYKSQKEKQSKNTFDFSIQFSMPNEFFPLEKSLNHWVGKLPENLAPIKPILEEVCNESIQELSQESHIINPIQFDMVIIDKMCTKLDAEKKASFAEHAYIRIKEYHTQVDGLSNQLMSVAKKDISINELLNKQIQPLNSCLQQASQEILNICLTSNHNFNVSPIASTLKSFVNNLTGEKNVTAITKTLFENIVTIANKSDSALDVIKDLEKQMIGNLPKSELVKIEAKVEILKEKYQKTQPDFQRTLSSIQKGLELAGTIAVLSGQSKLAQQIVTIGNAAVSIVGSIGTIMAGGAVLGPVGAIGAGVVCILGALGAFGGGGPSPEQKMMQQLSQQIVDLGKHLDKRFDQIEKMLDTIHHQMHQQFNIVKHMIDSFYMESIKNFRKLENRLNVLEECSRIVINQLNKIDNKLDQAFKELQMQNYKDKKFQALDMRDNDIKIRQNLIANYARDIKNFSTKNTKNLSLTGIITTMPSVEEICSRVNVSEDIAFNIGLLATYFNYGTSVINPIAWADASGVFMEMYTKYPEALINQDFKNDVNEIIAAGKEFNAFIKYLQSPNMGSKLCNDYSQSLKMLCAQLLAEQNVDSSTVKSALDNFNAHSKILLIYSYLAFSEECNKDEALSSQLHLQLWNKEAVLHFKCQLNSPDSKKYIIDAISETALKTIGEIEKALLIKAFIAEQYEHSGHPLINKVIQNLKIFEQFHVSKKQYDLQKCNSIGQNNDFKEKLSVLINEKSFKFDIRKMNDKVITIKFTGNATSMEKRGIDIDINISELVEVFKKAISDQGIKLNEYTIKVNWDERKLTIEGKSTIESFNSICKLLGESGNEHFDNVSRNIAARILFFKPETNSTNNQVSEKSATNTDSISCSMQ